MVAPCEIQLKLGNRLSAPTPPPPAQKKNVARTPMVRCSFHQASALEVNGPPNLSVLPTPLRHTMEPSYRNPLSLLTNLSKIGCLTACRS